MKTAVGLVRPDGGQVTLDHVPVERLGNLTGLVSSHNLLEVEQISHRIVVLHQGAVVRDATTRELLAGTTVRVRVNHPELLAEELRRRGRTAERLTDGTLRVSSVTTGEVGELAAYGGLPIVTALLVWIAAPAVGAWTRLRSATG